MEQQPQRACERTKSKQKQNQVTLHSNSPRVLLFDLVLKQCNGWLSMMSGYGANPIFFQKKKDWTSRTLATPTSNVR